MIQGLSFSSSGDWLAVSSARGTGHLFHLAAAAPSSQSVPAHLAAANAAGGAGGQGCSSVRGALPATKLVASGRVRGGGNGLLNGNIPGSAAASAAVSLYNGSPGKHAVCNVVSGAKCIIVSDAIRLMLKRTGAMCCRFPGVPSLHLLVPADAAVDHCICVAERALAAHVQLRLNLQAVPLWPQPSCLHAQMRLNCAAHQTAGQRIF